MYSPVLKKMKQQLCFFLKTFFSIFLAFSKAEIKTFKHCVIMTDEHKNLAFNYVPNLSVMIFAIFSNLI